ncbi:histidinol-phosphate transaminase [soil metagenome]
MFDLNALIRPNIRALKPYSSARSEFVGAAEVFLDANENAFGSPAGDGMNRYPDPLQTALKAGLAKILNVSPEQIFIGNGSDEAIDLLLRVFCIPGKDEIIICPPTYGMYRVSADINDVFVKEVPLTLEFQLDVPAILQSVTELTKIIFICSPNNPTGNLMNRDSIVEIAKNFDGLVVVDEAYIHFAEADSIVSEIDSLPNVVVLQTFSKAWGMAGIRVGIAIAGKEIVGSMNKVKPPYNVSGIAQQVVLDALDRRDQFAIWTASAIKERERMEEKLIGLDLVINVFPSDANFLLVRVTDAAAIYRYLIDQKIVVRDRSNVELCEGCLRITIGTPKENDRLIAALRRHAGSK